MAAPQYHLQAHLDHLYRLNARSLVFNGHSSADFAAWQSGGRAVLRRLLGLEGRVLPEMVVVNTVAVVDRGEYVEEQVALEVGEGVVLSAFFLIPRTPPPYKPILVFHGHESTVQDILGNFADQDVARQQLSEAANYGQALARAGYFVCAIQQRGFGERISDQYDTVKRNACRHLSFEYLLQGRTMIGERCWDGMIALTALQQRADCDTSAIGCTGHSGGGTTCLWLTALDDRIAVSVPSGCFSTFKDSILSMEHCECNYIPDMLLHGEMGDFAALIAPRPLRILAGTQDTIFPLEGASEQFNVARRVYELLGVPERCSLAVHALGHVYDHGLSQAWFRQWL